MHVLKSDWQPDAIWDRNLVTLRAGFSPSLRNMTTLSPAHMLFSCTVPTSSGRATYEAIIFTYSAHGTTAGNLIGQSKDPSSCLPYAHLYMLCQECCRKALSEWGLRLTKGLLCTELRQEVVLQV